MQLFRIQIDIKHFKLHIKTLSSKHQDGHTIKKNKHNLQNVVFFLIKCQLLQERKHQCADSISLMASFFRHSSTLTHPKIKKNSASNFGPSSTQLVEKRLLVPFGYLLAVKSPSRSLTALPPLHPHPFSRNYTDVGGIKQNLKTRQLQHSKH